MPIITKVSAQKRPGRYNIFLDQAYAFSVGERTLAEFALFKGKEVDDALRAEIEAFEASAQARDLAAKYLSYQPRTEKEITDYLIKREVAPAAAQKATKELKDLGYLDDRVYAQLFVKNNLQVGNSGPKGVSRGLAKKGVDPVIIDEVISEVDQGAWLEVGKRLVKSLMNQKGKIANREVVTKMKVKLVSHGFTSDLAEAIVQDFDLASQDAQQEALAKQGIKAYKRFRRYDEATRRQKMRQYLYSHGFSGDEITAFLNGEIVPLEELEEY